MHRHDRSRYHAGRAFALAELLTLLVLLAVVFCLAALAANRNRNLARIGEDLSHLRQIASATASYQADNTDLVWGYSWRAGTPHTTPWPDLNVAFSTDQDAAYAQACYIARTFGGRSPEETPLGYSTIVHLLTSNMPLEVYLGIPIPNRMFVAAGDVLSQWADDPHGYDQGLYTPNYGTGASNWRYPYRSSFVLGPAFFDAAPVGQRLSPADYNLVNTPLPTTLHQLPLTSVVHPSQKVLIHDRFSRYYLHFVWHMDPASRTTALFVDGSAGVRSFAEANPGADPNIGAAFSLLYNPPGNTPDPPVPTGTALYPPGPMWTRSQLRGRDFGGPEVFP